MPLSSTYQEFPERRWGSKSQLKEIWKWAKAKKFTLKQQREVRRNFQCCTQVHVRENKGKIRFNHEKSSWRGEICGVIKHNPQAYCYTAICCHLLNTPWLNGISIPSHQCDPQPSCTAEWTLKTKADFKFMTLANSSGVNLGKPGG